MTNKAIIFDSSTLINFAMNGVLDIFESLKKNFQGKFFITTYVKHEVIDRPLQIKRFELEALKIKSLLDRGIIELVEEREIDFKTQQILEVANRTFLAQYASGKQWIHLIDNGEASCIALSQILAKKGVENVVAVDERTTRMLYENPKNLQELLRRKFHTGISNSGNLSQFRDVRFIRSSELLFVAYKKGLVNLRNGDVLDALLYATKYQGNAISYEEIEQIKKVKI